MSALGGEKLFYAGRHANQKINFTWPKKTIFEKIMLTASKNRKLIYDIN